MIPRIIPSITYMHIDRYGRSTMENSVEVPQKIKNTTALWPSSSASEHFTEEIQNAMLKRYMHRWVHCSVFTIVKMWRQPGCASRDKSIPKRWYVCTVEFHSAVKKKGIFSFVTTWMDLEGIILSKISQTEKDKYRMISLTCGI